MAEGNQRDEKPNDGNDGAATSNNSTGPDSVSVPDSASAPDSTQFPDAYFTHCSPHDEHAQAMLALRRQEYYAWKSVIDFDHDDYEMMLQKLMKISGLAQHKTSDIIGAFYRMSDLPQLRELATSMWHIDLDRWITIDRAMTKAGNVNAHLFSVIDKLLVDLLTPSKPAQQMPSRRTIANRIDREIEAEDASVREHKRKSWSRKNYEVNDIPPTARNDDDSHEFRFDTDAATAVNIDAHIHEHAKQAGISLRDAAVELLLGKASTTVTLNCYRANDIDNAPLFVSTGTGAGFTTLFGAAADKFTAQARKHHDMDDALRSEVAGYATTPTMRSAVTGRDGHCRYPGCTKPASTCQMDHVVEYDKGGATSPTNLIALCQHHHNIKTDKRARPIFEPASGTVVWLFTDGTWQSTEADGPLAHPNRRWVQTLRQRQACYRKAHREEAQKQAQRLRRQTPQPGINFKTGTGWKDYLDFAAKQQHTDFSAKQQHSSFTTMTKTQEQQLWDSDLNLLKLSLDKYSFAAIKIKVCQEQLATIHQAIDLLRETGPGSAADGAPFDSAYEFTTISAEANTENDSTTDTFPNIPNESSDYYEEEPPF